MIHHFVRNFTFSHTEMVLASTTSIFLTFGQWLSSRALRKPPGILRRLRLHFFWQTLPAARLIVAFLIFAFIFFIIQLRQQLLQLRRLPFDRPYDSRMLPFISSSKICLSFSNALALPLKATRIKRSKFLQKKIFWLCEWCPASWCSEPIKMLDGNRMAIRASGLVRLQCFGLC